ncbi:transcription initiation factor TFIID subunit 13 [Nematocida homosporus]|uniref:transcription initiation factor TFIID subunit 13 n=1 Tax=Nematocida homosporus TaxID=1912981 RepID=UPI002220F8BE|nr:transcription initiation factor TFIID subunit 13 [Nematocida homosporus]KAI5186743.1 transcription initiation factor TFIID subunit 13 [Nematocida homosporus]
MKEKKPNFLREIRLLMYALGDSTNPRSDSANVIHDYVCNYLEGILKRAKHVSKSRGRTKTEDLLYTVKRDRKKYTRAKELLTTNEELKKARKAFEYDVMEKE